MLDRFKQFPAALAQQTRQAQLGAQKQIPAIIAHPNWTTPTPCVIWIHGRTVSKELDPGRYLRWIRAGIAACAIDLPGHGERLSHDYHHPRKTLDMLDEAIPEIDQLIQDLTKGKFAEYIDPTRLAIGGMSAGGMVTLRRLCDAHPFVCAAVESTAGDFDHMPDYQDRHPPEKIHRLSPAEHLEHWRPIPLLALHSQADAVTPLIAIESFVSKLRAHYADQNADPDQIELRTWPTTGAPMEHAGFGKVATEAKNIQVEFLTKHLLQTQP